MPAKNSHSVVKKHFGVRALVSLLMLVVDYEVPVNCHTGDVFNAWVRVINEQWAESHRLDAQAWASEQASIASDVVVRTKRVRPTCIDSLPYRKTYHSDGVNDLAHRMRLEQRVIRAVKELPPLYKSALRAVFEILQWHGPEFDDARAELIGMAFDFANGVGKDFDGRGANLDSLYRFARQALDERLVSSAPIAAPTTLTQSQKDIADEFGEMCAFLIAKNRKYGDSALNPVNIFSQEPAHVQLRQQIDHKLARIKRGDASIEDEDVVKDLVGYLHLYRIALRQWKKGQTNANA